MHPDELFTCTALACQMRTVCCCARQLAVELEAGAGPAPRRSSRAKRGRVPTFVMCRTELCAQGAAIRAALGDLPEARAMATRAPRDSDTSTM